MGRYSEFNEYIELLKQDENNIKYFRNFALENINSNHHYVKEILEYISELSKKWNYKIAEHWCLTYIGWCDNISNNFLKASTNHLIANQFFEKEQNLEGMIATCNGLLSDYLKLGEIELAIRNGIKGIELANEIDDEHNLIPLLINTAETYVESENYDEALTIIERLKSCDYDIKEAHEVAMLGILSKCKLNTNKLNEAYSYCNEALRIMEKNNDIVEKEEFMSTRAEINYRLGNIDEAIKEFQVIIENTIGNNDSYCKIKTSIRWAECYYNSGEYDLAKEKLFIATSDEKLVDFINLRVKVYELLKNIYSKMGEYKKAYEIFEKYDEYKKEANINHSTIWLSLLKYKSATNEAKAYKTLYKKIDLISEVGRKITSSLVLDEIVHLIYDEIGKLVESDIFGIALYNKEKDMLIYESFIENGEEADYKEISIEDNRSFGVYCFKSKKEVLINDIVNEHWKYVKDLKMSKEEAEKNPLSIIYLPILINDVPIGVLTVQSNKKNAYTRQDIYGLKILGSYIAIAIENGKIFNKVKYFASNDALTDILNRSMIIKKGNEMLQAKNQDNNNSIIMMDIDYFKTINDTYGHQVGDVVLKEVAAIIKEKIKEFGLVGRYGGEEFLILLPNKDLAMAKKISEEIRKGIEKYKYPVTEYKYGKVTVSLGIYEFARNGESFSEGLRKADKALYKAKDLGKNMSVNYI